VSAIEPVTWNKSEEKLGPICVRACVCHGQQAASVVTDVEVFIWEFSSVDRYSSCAVSCCEISSLGHEILNHTMEMASLVSKLFGVVTCAQAAEVFSSFRGFISVELQD